jgi:uncharacterized protein YigE (DUF2233 family)
MRTLALVFLGLVCASGAAAASPACKQRAFEGVDYTVCLYDSRAHEIRLAWTGADGQAIRSFIGLSRLAGFDGRRVRFAMNAGMYEKDGSPVGLFVANGRVEQPLNTKSGTDNFYLQPNGVFSVDPGGRVRVETTQDFEQRGGAPRWATQSGPMLVIGGVLHPAITPKGSSRKRRNGVGACGATIAAFVISEAEISFGELARFFRDELKCENALFLDGVVSSLWWPAQARIDAAHKLGPIAVVSERAPKRR